MRGQMNHINLQKQQTDRLTLSDTNWPEIFFHDSVINRQEMITENISMCIFSQTKHVNEAQKPLLKYV